MEKIRVDSLEGSIHDSRLAMGEAAATTAIQILRTLLEIKPAVNMIFAAAPSQNEFLEVLIQHQGIDWGRVNAFHMDEYVGLPENTPQRFGNFLKERLFARLPFRSINYLNGNAVDPQEECLRYTRLLRQHPTDIVCMGIGENCHIAFNDPHVADFNDPLVVKVVDLDDACRQQQVNDGCFGTLREVPTQAITLTVPALLRAPHIFCMVPGPTKAGAVWHTLHEEIIPSYPSTILRKHPNAILFLDQESAYLLQQSNLSKQ